MTRRSSWPALSIGLKGPKILIRLLERPQNFIKVSRGCFIGIAMESLLDDEEVWVASLEYRLKKAITFDATVVSRSNFFKSF